MNDAMVERLSPTANIPASGCQIIIAHADGEPAGSNHFDMLPDLVSDDTVLSRALVTLIKGSR